MLATISVRFSGSQAITVSARASATTAVIEAVPLVILGNNQDLELAILAFCPRKPVGIEDLYATRLLTCTWHASK
jgi:hypothetical protein